MRTSISCGLPQFTAIHVIAFIRTGRTRKTQAGIRANTRLSASTTLDVRVAMRLFRERSNRASTEA